MHEQAAPPLPLSPASGGEGPYKQAAAATPPSALILGGAHGALVIARSLARRGIRVDIVANHALPLFSRYIRHRYSWDESPQGPGPHALTELLALAQRKGVGGAVLFAGGDTEVRFIAENHAALAPVFRLTTPTWDALRHLFDKRLMHEHAAAIGLAVPLAWTPRDRAELETLPARLPLVLKPAIRTVENAFTLAKAWRADDHSTLLARYDEAAALVGADQIVLQELIPGGGEAQYSYAAVCDRGKPVAELVARRRRQYPVEFGYTSTLVETVACAEVEDAGRRLLASLDYTASPRSSSSTTIAMAATSCSTSMRAYGPGVGSAPPRASTSPMRCGGSPAARSSRRRVRIATSPGCTPRATRSPPPTRCCAER